MAKTSKPTSTSISKSTSKPNTDKPVILNYIPKGIIKEGYQPTNTVDTSNPPRQNTDKKE